MNPTLQKLHFGKINKINNNFPDFFVENGGGELAL